MNCLVQIKDFDRMNDNYGNLTLVESTGILREAVGLPITSTGAIGNNGRGKITYSASTLLTTPRTKFTVAFWLKTNSSHAEAYIFASYTSKNGFAVGILNNRLIIYRTGGYIYDVLTDEIPLNEWVYIEINFTNGIVTGFINGQKDKTGSFIVTSSALADTNVGLLSLESSNGYRVDGSILDFIILDDIWHTGNYSVPTHFYGSKLCCLDLLDSIWGIDSTSTFKQLATNWSTKSDSDKLALLESIEDIIPSVSDLSTIGKFKVIAIKEGTPIIKTTVKAIPKTQIIYPTKLIKTAPFEKLNSVSITATSSGAGDIKVAVTTDLSTYKVWDKVTLAWIDIPKSDVATRGMSVSDISTLTDTEWNMLVSYGVGDGIAFAYSLDINADTDKAEIDALTLNAEMRGSWNKAFHGTDYTYGYPFYDQLSVKLLTDGSYKINYHD